MGRQKLQGFTSSGMVEYSEGKLKWIYDGPTLDACSEQTRYNIFQTYTF